MEHPHVFQKHHHTSHAEKRVKRNQTKVVIQFISTKPRRSRLREKWEGVQCPICLQRIRPGNYVELPCHPQHRLHREKCYQLLQQSRCPLCRADI